MPGRIIYYDVDGRRIRRFDESPERHLSAGCTRMRYASNMQMKSSGSYYCRTTNRSYDN